MEELLRELEEAKAKIAEIEKKIEEKQVETGRWKPEEGGEYWFIDSCGQVQYDCGQVQYDVWKEHCIDNKRYEIGNCYKTKAEAEFVAEKLKVIAELKEYAEPKNRAWDGTNIHYYISDFRASFSVTAGRNGSSSINNDLFKYVQNGNRVEVIGNIYDNPELLEVGK